MTSTGLITGSMGGGGGGGSSAHNPVEAPNTLQSRSYGVIMDILGEGLIKLRDGGKSILLNGVPLLASDGTPNFNGVSWAMQPGYPSQAPIAGFNQNDLGDVAYTTTVNTRVKNGSPGPIIRSVSDANATSVVVVLQVPALFKTDTSNGDINPSLVEIKIETRANSAGSWSTIVEDTIEGKCTSTYQRQYRIVRPSGPSAWQIRVTRVTADSTTSDLVNETWWSSYTVSYDNLMEYPHTAYVMLQFNSELFGSSAPTRLYDVWGAEILIPSNYNPSTRVYTGIWDGTFVSAYSNNPAWIFYDLVTNDWFGAGNVINPSSIDKWALYACGQYCDVLVPNGEGGMEPRFTFNGVIDRADEALRLLQQIAAMFDSVVYSTGDSVTLVQDRDMGVVKLLTPANVINGEFVYEGTALSTRPTAIRGLFIDPLDNWVPSVEPVEDPELVAKHGYIAQDLQLLGVTSRGQAARKGLNTIDMSWTSGELVRFEGGLDMLDLEPGSQVLIADPLYAGTRLGGRCAIGCTTTSMVLDAPIKLEIGETYTIYVTYPDGTVDVRNITTTSDNADHSTVSVSPALTTAPNPESVWLIAASNVNPREFRILTATEKSPTSLQFIGALYDTTRRDRIELGIRTKPPKFSVLPELTAPLPPPTGLTIQENLAGVGNTTVVRVFLSWSYANDPRIGTFQIEAINSAGATFSFNSSVNSLTTEALPRDTYVFRVRCVSKSGDLVSAWLESAPEAVDGVSPAPSVPTALTATGGIKTVQLRWVASPERDIAYYDLQRAPDSGGSPGSFSSLGNIKATSYVDADGTVLAPNTKWWYRVRAVSTTGIASSYTSAVYAITSLLITSDLDDAIFQTAKAAKGIFGVRIIPNTGTAGAFDDQLAWKTDDNTLVKWVASSSTWVPADNPTQGWFNNVVAAFASFGGLKADQIAATEIYGYHMAAAEIISDAVQIRNGTIENAHIGNLEVDNAKIANLTLLEGKIADGAITDVPTAQSSTISVVTFGTASDVLTLSVTVPANAKVILMMKCNTYVPVSGGTSPGSGETGGF